MPRGNTRRVILSGPYAIKVPRADRQDAGRCLNRWEAELWSTWRPKFGWTYLCPVLTLGTARAEARASNPARRLAGLSNSRAACGGGREFSPG
jgi:hypothetical protein